MIPNLVSDAVNLDEYEPGHGDYTTTSLLSPPKRTWLAMNHKPREETRREKWPSFVGNCIHYRLEMEAEKHEDALVEMRFYHTFPGIGLGEKKDIVIGGKPDVVWKSDEVLDDYKTTVSSNPNVKEGLLSEPYQWQGHYNAFLAFKDRGLIINKVRVHYLITDFRYGRSLVDPKHPKDFHKVFVFKPKPMKEIEEHMRNTIYEHEQAKLGQPRSCRKDEMWVRDEHWACKKPANKRARKKHYSREAAESDLKAGEIIDHRRGERVYCATYCGFGEHCPQHQAWVSETKSLASTGPSSD